MNVKQLMTDDDAVSPVIGVILMVAITVILAAVIATFVLGLGDQVSDSSPQASFSFDWDGTSGNHGDLDITHGGGQSIEAQNIYVRGSVGNNAGTGHSTLSQTWGSYPEASASGTSKVSAGMSITFEKIGSDGEIRVVWEGSSGDDSSTLSDWTGPDA